MKYSEKEYVEARFYGDPIEREREYSAKVVKIRFDRRCVNCQKRQARGQHMLRETCILEDEGRRDAYTCLHCIDKWLDHIKGGK